MRGSVSAAVRLSAPTATTLSTSALSQALSIVHYGDLPVSPGDTERTYAQVEEGLAPVAADVFPIALGGDHSVTLAELRALAKRHGLLALVLLDAHADNSLEGVLRAEA